LADAQRAYVYMSDVFFACSWIATCIQCALRSATILQRTEHIFVVYVHAQFCVALCESVIPSPLPNFVRAVACDVLSVRIVGGLGLGF
jgi:hypothetical protein